MHGARRAPAKLEMLSDSLAGVAENCRTVHTGQHYSSPAALPSFTSAASRTIDVRFLPSCATYKCGCAIERCGADNLSSWNKLWGASRCGYLHSHHQDSDRFVWRRTDADGKVELATYSYDGGRRPYSPDDPHLLQPFATLLSVNVTYRLSMHVASATTNFTLYTRHGSLLEQKQNQHKNQCALAARGYRLGFYFGGQCPAPTPVTACFSEQHDDNVER